VDVRGDALQSQVMTAGAIRKRGFAETLRALSRPKVGLMLALGFS